MTWSEPEVRSFRAGFPALAVLASAALIALVAGVAGTGFPRAPWGAVPARSAGAMVFADRTPGTPLEGFRGAVGGPEQWSVLEQNGQGLALFDADGDGDLDIFLPRGGAADGFFLNLGDWRFEDASAASGLAVSRWSNGAAACDYDADGDIDLFVARFGTSSLYANLGDGTFRDVTAASGIRVDGYAASGLFFDADADGDLDLYVCRYVVFDPVRIPREENGAPCTYRGVVTGCGPWMWKADTDLFFLNRLVEDGGSRAAFVDASASWGVSAAGAYRSFMAAPIDLEGDGDLDLAVGADVMPNLLLENRSAQGEPRFTVAQPERGFRLDAQGREESAMGLAVFDADLDGRLDLLTTNFAGQDHTLFLGREGGLEDGSASRVRGGFGMDTLSWGTAVADFDGDGLLDLAVASGHIYPQVAALDDPADRYEQDLRLWRGSPAGMLVAVPLEGAPLASFRGLATGDLDGDGDPDLAAVRHGGPPLLLENRSAPPGALREVRLQGRAPNTQALGASLGFRWAGRTLGRWCLPLQGYQSSHDPRFALPAECLAEGLEVRWPSGRGERFAVPSGSAAGEIVLREGEGAPQPR